MASRGLLEGYFAERGDGRGEALKDIVAVALVGVGVRAARERLKVNRGLAELADQAEYPFDNAFVLESLYDVAEQLNPHLASYDLVIADDTSGRLPGLLYWRLVNARRRDHGLEPAAIKFINGRHREALPEGLLPEESTDRSRTLIVTEYISSGGSVRRLYQAAGAQRRRENIDIAATGVSSYFDKDLESDPRIIYPAPRGQEMDAYLYCGYRTQARKAVWKDNERYALHATPLPPEIRDTTLAARARQDINRLAETFYGLLPVVAP